MAEQLPQNGAISGVPHTDYALGGRWADTTTHVGKMIMTIFAGIAEFERDLIRERTGAGRADARKRGVRFDARKR
jgi:DNA invertase Pin-like site-specific DNA recombinase